jgi:hypothetical protein
MQRSLSTDRQSVRGYNVIAWTADGVTYWAVSDLNPGELQAFTRLFRAAPLDHRVVRRCRESSTIENPFCDTQVRIATCARELL